MKDIVPEKYISHVCEHDSYFYFIYGLSSSIDDTVKTLTKYVNQLKQRDIKKNQPKRQLKKQSEKQPKKQPKKTNGIINDANYKELIKNIQRWTTLEEFNNRTPTVSTNNQYQIEAVDKVINEFHKSNYTIMEICNIHKGKPIKRICKQLDLYYNVIDPSSNKMVVVISEEKITLS